MRGIVRGANGLRGARGFGSSDIYEARDRYLIRMDLPGVGRDDLTVRYDEGRLIVAGRKPSLADNGIRYHLKESFSGDFDRRFLLPDAAAVEAIEAEVRDGVLTVHIPKREELKPREVEIKVR